MCAAYDIPLLTLHDFDVTGFSIGEKVGSTSKRYIFKNKIKVINLGLRLIDVETLELESEEINVRGDPKKVGATLRQNGATEDEIEFLLGGQRVELNALRSDQFIALVETKLTEHGIKKVVPSPELLTEAYQLFVRSRRIERIVEEALEEDTGPDIDPPDDLVEQVCGYLAEHRDERWDDAVAALAAQAEDAS